LDRFENILLTAAAFLSLLQKLFSNTLFAYTILNKTQNEHESPPGKNLGWEVFATKQRLRGGD
jgi:hypothetical protein